MRPKILEEHDSELIIYVNGKIKTIPNNPYTKLKKMQFDDNRIIYKFADFVEAIETYNPRIFNLIYDKFRVTVRQDKANQVCEAIADHYKKGDYTKFKELFLNVYSVEHQSEIVEKFILDLSPKVTVIKKDFRHETGKSTSYPVYIINNKFAVDPHVTSYYKREDDGDWAFLCTVVEAESQTYKILIKGVGWAKLNANTCGVIAKVLFFLNPNAKDGVFMNQLKNKAPDLYKTLESGKYE